MHIIYDSGKYSFFNQVDIREKLEPKNYLFSWGVFGNCFLMDENNFSLPEKVYDVDGTLRSYIKTSFAKNDKNLGVLLTGNKGQGKSLTAKILCKELNLPVVILNSAIPANIDFISFLQNIEQDFILFIDEFEKLFGDRNENSDKENSYHNQEVFLSFMDGVRMQSKNKILFLLTTNEAVSTYLINRPSRIKFLKEYDELPQDLFNLIADDLLQNKDFKADLVKHVSLNNLNIDLLISIINDINLFDKPFSEFRNIYNYKHDYVYYELFISINNSPFKFKSINKQYGAISSDFDRAFGYNVEQLLSFSKDEIIFKSQMYLYKSEINEISPIPEYDLENDYDDEEEGTTRKKEKIVGTVRLVRIDKMNHYNNAYADN